MPTSQPDSSIRPDLGYEETDYEETDYEDADYEETDYEDADYEETDYEDADYEDADYEDADYEDADYEETDYEDTISSSPNRKSFDLETSVSLSDDRFIHTILIHRCDREIQRRNEQINQLSTLIAAMGFLISLFSIISGNDSLFSDLKQRPNIQLLLPILFIVFIIFIIYSFCVYLRTRISETDVWWDYPGDNFLKQCKDPSQDFLINIHNECSSLAKIILDNTKKNEKSSRDMNIITTLFCLFAVICSIFFVYAITDSWQWVIVLIILSVCFLMDLPQFQNALSSISEWTVSEWTVTAANFATTCLMCSPIVIPIAIAVWAQRCLVD